MKETDIIKATMDLLDKMYDFIDKSVWRETHLLSVKSLQEEMFSPCVLAIAGKVKAGKSFLVNSLLGVDLAMTGTTETTATINIFKKGKPLSKEKPILCQYVDGSKEWKTKSFLDQLQGTSEQTLKITSTIDRIIYYIDDNPLLEEVTLVDTPGIGADVGDEGDSHEIHTDSYFNLRKRHQKDTVNLSNSADAVIYIFNTVPTETDKTFLSALHDDGNGITPLNGVGVLSKIDKEIEQMNNVPKFAKTFEHELYTIVPTSAAISRYMPSKDECIILQGKLQKGFGMKGFKLAMGSETSFLHENLPDCTLTVCERQNILKGFADNDLPWSAFSIICRELYETSDIDASLDKLQKISGVSLLKNLLEEHFFQRSRLLRCNKVLMELYGIIKNIKYDNSFIDADYYAKNKEHYIEIISGLDNSAKEMLTQLIQRHIPSTEEVKRMKSFIKETTNEIDAIRNNLNNINYRYLAFRKVLQNRSDFSEKEFDELSEILNGKDPTCNPIVRRQYWMTTYNCSIPNSTRQIVAEIAKEIYDSKINL